MSNRIDLFYSAYKHFGDQVMAAVRHETFGQDIGQNSWLTVDEFDRFISWLELVPNHHVLEIASGSGGPARYLASKVNCLITGIDSNENAVTEASRNAAKSMRERLAFRVADADKQLPFENNSFDRLICIDSMNHFPHRLNVLEEWHRVLKSGGKALFTDPVVITGPVTNDELAQRSSIGLFLFVPPGINEHFIELTGFHLAQTIDVTENAALVSNRWYQARERHQSDLIKIEGNDRFQGIQKFLEMVYRLTSEKRLSRIVYLIEKKLIEDQRIF